jgi:hypothetical protein
MAMLAFPTALLVGPTLIQAMMESEFHEDNGGFLRDEEDCTKVALGMMGQGVFFRAKFDVKKIKRKDGTIKEKKVLVHAGQQQHFNPKVKEPYVWRYNPLEKRTILKGFMLIAAICFCAALPLWPIWLRNSVAGSLLFIVLGRSVGRFDYECCSISNLFEAQEHLLHPCSQIPGHGCCVGSHCPLSKVLNSAGVSCQKIVLTPSTVESLLTFCL